MPCTSPCKNCDRTGLPILFTRYAVAYSAQAESMNAIRPLGPTGNLQARPGGVALKTACYNLRMLRAGYLYIHVDRGDATAGDAWSAYAVHPHGYLTEFPVNLPEQARAQPACEVEVRGANASMVWIRDAGRVKKLWYMFHPDPIDYEHLTQKIEPSLATYMQCFDVAGWANGNLAQADTTQPGQLNGQVVEFSAMTSEAVRNAIEPQLYGLMGSNAIERGWGDYEEEQQFPQFAITGEPLNTTMTVHHARKGHTYQSAHGARLKKIGQYLQQKGGAVVACDDPLGIAQELGHLQVEAQRPYTQWQKSQAQGCSPGVTNEWAFQTATGAMSLMELVKKGAVDRVNKGFEEAARIQAPLPHDPRAAAVEKARRAAARAGHRTRATAQAMYRITSAYDQLFDQEVATRTLAAHYIHYTETETAKSNLCGDQMAWLTAATIDKAIARFSRQDKRVGQAGGGGALTAQLAQCMAGTESNSAGQAWLRRQDLTGNGLLARALCFNSVTLKQTWKKVIAARPESVEQPTPESTNPALDGVSDDLKVSSAWANTGDKTLGFANAWREAKVNQAVASIFVRMASNVSLASDAQAFLSNMKTLSDSAALRKLAWPSHIVSLLSVKMIQSMNGLPVTRMESVIVRYAALSGLINLGKTAQEHGLRMKLPQSDQDALLQARRKLVNASHMADFATRAPAARAAGLAFLLDLGQAVIKRQQLMIKGNARMASEMAGNLLQAVGSLLDWRAKAYEETVFKGIKAFDLLTATAEEVRAAETLQTLQLKKLRLTAFKFLLPAAMVSAFWDGMDALQSDARGNWALARAQWASVTGTAFTITSTLMMATGALFGISTATWALIAAALGFAGAVITLAAVVAIIWVKEEEWASWLRDNPLNKSQKGNPPIHRNLQQTLQQLSNAHAAAA
ncbi:T6SS effector BTH_I2691 family protein [Variovorax paradoxus]|uniref:Toxin VasX N-terminal region domain-containing protein n=1 Tax=Variovorax paradoxus TaxID=34073 RepID=A0A679IHH0_VARPD|nr:hypothetical protein VVAX_00165 [Variovorax paradoxus]